MQNRITTEKNTFSKSNHIDIKQKVDYIESLFSESDIRINPQSSLSQLLTEVKGNFSELNTEALMIKALYVSRISDAMVCLENFDNRKKYLYDLLNGSLDVLEHEPSHAKSILFELDTVTEFQLFVKESYLAEPDIVVPIGEDEIGVSCKKISSENSLQNTLSKAVKQIKENSFKYGIVAINIDDLLPGQALMTADTPFEVNERLHKHNMDFIERHQRHFRKYLNESRILAVMVSSSIFVDMKSSKPRFNTASHRTIWTIENLNEEQKKVLNNLKKEV